MRTKKMKRQQIIGIVLGSFMLCGFGVASAEPVIWADNGHYYELINDAPMMSWEEARDWAFELNYTDASGELYKGHLATITSSQEAQFLETLRFTKTTYLLGGYQTPSTGEITLAEKKADWHWVTGEAWDFTDWRASEPNNFFRWVGVTGAGQVENYLQYIPLSDDRGWNDVYSGTFTDSDGEHFFGSTNYIIEYEAASQAPDLQLLIVTVDGVNVNLDWSAMPVASSYTLYYAFADDIGEVDMSTLGAIEMLGATTFFAPNLPSGLVLYTAIIAHTDQGDILSNIVKFMPFGGSVTYSDGVDNVLMQLDDPGGIGIFTISGSMNGDTAHITQITGNDGSETFVLTVVDDKPVTYVAGDLTINFTSLADGSVVVQSVQPQARASARAQDVLDCQERINGLITLYTDDYNEDFQSLSGFIQIISKLAINQNIFQSSVETKAMFILRLFTGARQDLYVKFNEKKDRLEQEYQECDTDNSEVIDVPANSCRLLYDPSLDEDGDHMIWVGNEENGFMCYYYNDTDTGRIRSEIPFLNSVKNGIATSFYEDGTLQGEITWLNGEQHGMSRTYFPNGNPWYETPMSHNLQDGVQKIYYESGGIKQEIPWYQGDDFVDGIYKRYGDNGNLNYETTFDENGKETGVRKQYYESGQLKYFVTIISNRFNGEGKFFYESGKLQLEEFYVDGEYHGEYREFREDGTLRGCQIYDHGSHAGSCMPK